MAFGVAPRISGLSLISPLPLFVVNSGSSALLLTPPQIWAWGPAYDRLCAAFPFVLVFAHPCAFSASFCVFCVSPLLSWFLCERLSLSHLPSYPSIVCFRLSLTLTLSCSQLPSPRFPPSPSTFCLSLPPFLDCGEAGAIYLSETGSANLNHLSPAAGNYLEVGTGPGNCCLHRPAAQGLLLHASPCGGSLGAMPGM